MQLLYPLGLLAIASVIVPIIIHLWNVKQSKTLKIGSIALLGESSRQSSKSFKITDWPLFILRCLLLIILAFLLTQPFVRSELGSGGDTGWILVEKSQLKNIYKNQGKEIDSLIKSGYELHNLNTGFAELKLNDTSLNSADTTNKLTYPALVKQLNTALPPGFKVYVFAENKLSRYEGDLPQITLNLHWKTIQNEDSLHTWVSRAFFTDKDSIRTFLTHSTSTGNYVEVLNLSDDAAKKNRIMVRVDSGKTQLKSIDQPYWVNVDTSSLHISIYQNVQGGDESYVQSAIMAIRQFTQMKIKVDVENHSSAISPSSDFVFWLSTQPVDKKLSADLKKGATIFSYEPGKEEQISSVLNFNSVAGNSIKQPELYKRIAAGQNQNDVVWSDGFGLPVLDFDQSGRVNKYHFYSRFNPQYSNLVWSENFVKALMPVVIPSIGESLAFGFEKNPADLRQINSEQQWLHKANFTGETADAKIYTDKPLNNALWLIALLLFTGERIMSFRKK